MKSLPRKETSWSYPRLRSVASRIANSSLLGTRTYRLKRYPNCFVGEDAVSFMVEQGICEGVEDAVALGNQMLDEGLLHHVCYEHPFLNDRKFYRLVFKNAFADEEELYELAEQVEELEEAFEAKRREAEEGLRRVDVLHGNMDKLTQQVNGLALALVLQAALLVFILDSDTLRLCWTGLVIALTVYFVRVREDTGLKRLNDLRLNEKEVGDMPGNVSSSGDVVKVERTSSERRFDVSEEEAVSMRELLQKEFDPAELELISKEYICSVMSKPNSKNRTLRRSFDYSHKKLRAVVLGRRKVLASGNDSLLDGPLGACGSIYWHGYTSTGHPILWVRSKLKDWDRLTIEDEVYLHLRILDEGLKLLPEGIHTFVIISDASGLGIKQTNPTLMRQLLNLLLKVYPDRLEALHAGPVNPVLRGLVKLLKKAMPIRVQEKIHLFGKNPYAHFTQVLKLRAKQIPTYYGGSADHQFEPDQRFNWRAMVKRQREQLSLYSSPRSSPS